ncbi:cbb3-type cytochrome c oxidase subunit II [Psychroflexus gondwanensis ACAM 44]|uniref:Cbb3-type cytochrome c oxidase subunit II n=1 Tax=Psychroflexus gondwanensis ACAM 44 TaxID=1189619 RepID=N1WJY2_9FLAO|nr:cbb3-type cytochrome c oxidase subunit II [Psychroflexus gondwanensis]EMY80526.1 cbb3-type cytochrome c oxidase subunit II [Psychroflexus gondwanensis ACAM 44]
MLNLHKDHKNLVLIAFSVFVALSIGVAIIPAYQMQEYEPIPGQKDLTNSERKGLGIYVSENCVACHTQQVRNIEMDAVWGDRPSLPSDYFYSKQRMGIWRQSPSLLGSERTGPDLTDIGNRQPSDQWHLLHLYNPRLVVEASIMPRYSWLFRKTDTTAIQDGDITLPRGNTQMEGSEVMVAKEDALHLVAYLKSLKQFSFEDASPTEFIPALPKKEGSNATSTKSEQSMGANLYQNNCAACHQGNGRGVKGAFPPLNGSLIVNDENPEMLIKIILMGYDARQEYGMMPALADNLTDEEIKAIVDYERSSWGNSAPKVPKEIITRLRDSISNLP